MNHRELSQLVKTLAKRDVSRSEATIQADVRALLLSGVLSLEDSDLIEPEVALEAQVGDGTRRRIDIEAGFCVIEIKKKLTASVEAEAIDTQLPGYVRTREHQTGARYTGLLTDGRNWKLYRLADDDRLHEVRALALDESDPDVDSLLVWLESVFATGQHLPATPDNVTERLGAGSPGFALDIATLTEMYESVKRESEVALKRELWAKSLSTALGTQFVDSDELFVNHTYLVTVAELVAHAAVGLDIASSNPNDLLTGAQFRTAGFRGVVEADFFDWVTDIENTDAAAAGARFVTELGRRVARFDWSVVEHDVLKALYESVISAETRHALGEYYTPDWLAAEIVATTVSDPLHQRVLDPSCGSGTFLFAAIKAIKAEATREGLSPSDTLERVVSNVIGLDLHPVAVTLARVTYLLGIGRDLYSARSVDGVFIPVFLGDSLQWERKSDGTVFDHDGLTVQTNDGLSFFAGELNFPAGVLTDVQRFDGLVAELAHKATNRKRHSAKPKLSKVLLAKYGVSDDDAPTVTATFNEMCDLHDHYRDHIWGYYVRNLARPLWLARIENRVDVLVGNPPWLAQRFMSAKMQSAFKERGEALKVRPAPKFAPHSDLSAFFVVTAVDRYLKVGGRFGFVMPRGALGGPHYKEFRRAAYPPDSGRAVSFEQPWDLAGIRPHLFPVPSCVVFGSNTSSDQENDVGWSAVPMPRTAMAWAGRVPKSVHSTPDSVHKTTVAIIDADNGPQSPYHDRAFQGATLVPRSLIFVVERDAGPLDAPAGMTAVASRRGGDKDPWKSLPDMTGAIESRFLHPTVLGSTLVHFGLLEPEVSIVPWDGDMVMDSSTHEIEAFPGLHRWWKEAEQRWDEHGTGKMTLRERIDYQSTLTNQFPIAPLRVMYTTSGTYLAAVLVNDPELVCDHKAYWIPVTTAEEGHYLACILNSDALLDQFSPLQSTGQFGTRDFHRYPLYPPIPQFDLGDELHARIAQLGVDAASAVSALPYRDMAFVRARQMIRQHLDHIGLSDLIDEAVTALTTTSTET